MNLFIPGIPVAQPRHRTGRNGRTYEAERGHPIYAYKAAIKKAAKEPGGLTLAGPVEVDFEFVFPRLKTASKKERWGMSKISKPDIDNLVKAVFDALNGLAFFDDSQVAAVIASKRYVREGELPGTLVKVRQFDDES